MRLRICHTTEFSYEVPAFQSHNELRMVARDGFGQRVIESSLDISAPAASFGYNDYFGNHVYAVSIHQPHDSLRIAATSLIEKLPEERRHATPVAFEEFLQGHSPRIQSQYDFLSPSRMVPVSAPLRKYFETLCPQLHEDVAGFTARVIAAVHQQFQYEPGVTRVDSSVDEILARRAGVCQDLAHLAIGVLRLAAVPARYVSGYLALSLSGESDLTFAAQASHAWLEAQLPGVGWVGFDPTHGCATDIRHVRVAVGRDYSDVPPVRGVYRGNRAGQTMKIDLQVDPVSRGPMPLTDLRAVRNNDLHNPRGCPIDVANSGGYAVVRSELSRQ